MYTTIHFFDGCKNVKAAVISFQTHGRLRRRLRRQQLERAVHRDRSYTNISVELNDLL